MNLSIVELIVLTICVLAVIVMLGAMVQMFLDRAHSRKVEMLALDLDRKRLDHYDQLHNVDTERGNRP